MPKTLVMTFLDFAEAEGYNAALSRIEDIQASLTDIMEASDQPLYTMYATSLLIAINDVAIVLNRLYLQDIQHRATAAKGSLAKDLEEEHA
ncbi:MAG: hypothetical protein GTO63_15855, partial [Anaerolineae bacterium]|nr:hypothetical protein [Anaerolineae bacterium]NIN96301.1 hypothetical protein [Anaerolineae bacterium]NIQ79321.1 hypothetical protein [Anaerolineae bacterium]